MQVMNITQYEDGSSWAATLNVGGFVMCAVLVANTIRVHQVARKDRKSAPKWAPGHVKKWAEKEVEKLSSEWMSKHREMYAE